MVIKKLVCVSLCAMALAGCKTTEANYKAAYEVAKAARQQREQPADDGLDENTRRMLARDKASANAMHIVGNDTIRVTTLFVKPVDDTVDAVPQYSVVLNSFSQVFNAKAMCRRLRENGFAGAYIFQTATPDYYVAAAGTNDLDSVPAILGSIHDPQSLGARAGFPAVIRSGGFRKKKSK